MFGSDKKKLGAFSGFDLEKDLQDDKKQEALLKKTEKHIHDIKNQLRQGTKPEDFEKFGVLLHGYSALLKILTKTSTS